MGDADFDRRNIGCTAQSLNEWVKKAEILVEGDDEIALVTI